VFYLTRADGKKLNASESESLRLALFKAASEAARAAA